MAKKKVEGSDAVRAFIRQNPTWSDAQVHGALKAEGSGVTREDVGAIRAGMGAKHTWKD